MTGGGAAARDEIRIGISTALTGLYARQGKDGLKGIELWVRNVNREGGLSVPSRGGRLPVRLIVYDDLSRAESACRNVKRLLVEDRVDVLFGPYSSGLTMSVAPLAAEAGKLLWNHGGTSDALIRNRHLIHVPSPASDYFRALPALLKAGRPEVRRLSLLHDRRGTFAANVIAGLVESCSEEGISLSPFPFESPVRQPADLVAEALARRPGGLVVAGRYQDDVEVVRACAECSDPPKFAAAVAAGLFTFGDELGSLAEGVVGTSQWEPRPGAEPGAGPGRGEFIAAFQGAYGEIPQYPAAQAYAVGIILEKCVEATGDLDDGRLREAARGLDLSTLFGRFRLDPATGRQVGHRIRLVQWINNRKLVLWPDPDAGVGLEDFAPSREQPGEEPPPEVSIA